MELCEVCGTENRDGAKFCRGCARALLPIAAGGAAGDIASNRALRCGVCKAIHSRGAQTCQACGHSLGEPKPAVHPADETPQSKTKRWPWVLALLLAFALVVAALATRGENPAEPGETSTAAHTAQESPEPIQLTQSVPELTPATAPMDASMSAAEKAKFDELVAREAERAEKSRQSIARLAEQERAAKKARAAAKAAAERQRAEAERQVAPDQPVVVAPVKPKPEKADAPISVKPPPVAKQTVEQACASATNFLSRDLCRIDACREASNARDPICVWYRRIAEERKNQQAN